MVINHQKNQLKKERETYRFKSFLNVHKSWDKILDKNIYEDQSLMALKREHMYVETEDKFCPYSFLSVFDNFSVDKNNIKVVIVLDHPYADPSIDNGYGLAYKYRNTKNPPLMEMLQASLILEYEDETAVDYFDTSLKFWRDQGVMVLYTAPTCKAGQPTIFKDKWKRPMQDIIRAMSREMENVVFCFLGDLKDDFRHLIGSKHVLMSIPPPLASYYDSKNMDFYDAEMFKSINYFLKELKKEPIQWLKRENS